MTSKKPEFSCFLLFYSYRKNNSLRVERHELLLSISKKQAESKDHNNNIDGETTRAELQELRNSYNSAMLNKKRTHVPV